MFVGSNDLFRLWHLTTAVVVVRRDQLCSFVFTVAAQTRDMFGEGYRTPRRKGSTGYGFETRARVFLKVALPS